jgi:chlorophyllide a reductase subunit Z
MGYAGACYLLQEVCNALFDALFHILPLGTDLDADRCDAGRLHSELAWDAEAEARLEQELEREPVLLRISAAKRLRDAAEQRARVPGEDRVRLVEHLGLATVSEPKSMNRGQKQYEHAGSG